MKGNNTMNNKNDKHRAHGDTNIPNEVLSRFNNDTIADIYLAECYSTFLDEHTFDSLCHVLAKRIAFTISTSLKE